MSNRSDRAFLSFSFFTSEPNSTFEYYAWYGSYLGDVYMCVCVAYTRERYTGVCARGINLRAFRDNCAGSYCCPRRGGCVQRCCANSFVIRTVFKFWTACNVFRHGALFRFSWSVPPERVTTLKVTRPRQHRFPCFFERDVYIRTRFFSSLPFPSLLFRLIRRELESFEIWF